MGTATGLTAARMQEIIDQQILAGAVDLSGNLIMTRANGSTFNAGAVKGTKGDPAVYKVISNTEGTEKYIRLAVLDGVGSTSGAHLTFFLSGLGSVSTARRGTALVHISQRGSNTIDLRGWTWGLDATPANTLRLFTRQTGEFMFELWMQTTTWNREISMSVMSNYAATLYFDNVSTSAPTSLVAGTMARSDSPAASQTLAGIIEIATNAEVQTGTDAVRAVTPAGLASVVGAGTGYRFAQRVIFTSSGTFSKASYPGVRAIRVLVVGGGGSGAGSGGASGGMNSYGTGGGSGAYAESFITDIASLAASVAVTVGAGGAATAAGALQGNSGSASSFGTAVVAGGGEGGYPKPNTALGAYIRGGLGGIATAGDIRQDGTVGGKGSGRDTLAQAGDGASSIFGGGGLGNAGGGGSASYAGAPGGAYGAGGGGASTNAGGAAAPSGAGASGVVIVEVYR